jgi:hypothetical protein
MLRPNELLIGDHNWREHAADPVVDGEHKARGLIPRDYRTHPVGFYAAIRAFYAVDFPLIDRSEWPARIKDKTANKTWLSDMRLVGNNGQPIPSRDQDGKGYCWQHSGVSCALAERCKANMPYADLSAYAGACIQKNYRDEGGWGAAGVDWMIANGMPTSEFWPQRSMDRSNDNPAMRENAKLHRIVEGWIDLAAAQYDRKLTFDQYATCLLVNEPCVADFNWWSHSVCAIDLTDGNTDKARKEARAKSGKKATTAEYEQMWGVDDPYTAGFGIRIWNSWGDSWSDRGMGTLTGSRAVPDGGVAIRTTTPSMT